MIAVLDKRSGLTNEHLFLTSVLTGWVTTEEILKPLFHRPRPYLSTLGLNVHTPLPLQNNASFPSGAAVVSFAALVPFVAFYPRSNARTAMACWALIIMFSRVYVGAHYPSDVFAGMVVGSMVGFGWLWYDILMQRQRLLDIRWSRGMRE